MKNHSLNKNKRFYLFTKYFFKIFTDFESLLLSKSDVVCRTSNSKRIPVLRYFECLIIYLDYTTNKYMVGYGKSDFILSSLNNDGPLNNFVFLLIASSIDLFLIYSPLALS